MWRDEEINYDGVKTLRNGVRQESRSCAGGGILWVASEVISGAVLCELVFFVFSIWSAGKPVKTELQ